MPSTHITRFNLGIFLLFSIPSILFVILLLISFLKCVCFKNRPMIFGRGLLSELNWLYIEKFNYSTIFQGIQLQCVQSQIQTATTKASMSTLFRRLTRRLATKTSIWTIRILIRIKRNYQFQVRLVFHKINE